MRRAISSFLTATLMLGLAPAPALAKEAPASPTVMRWRRDVDAIVATLKQSKWKPARSRAQRLLGEMCDSITHGEGVGRSLSVTLSLLAVAEMGVGQERDAFWHWQIANQLFPDSAKLDLSAFGEPGAKLARGTITGDGSTPSLPEIAGNAVQPTDASITAPRKTRAPMPKFPLAKRVPDSQIDDAVSVVLSVVIDTEGVPQRPLIMNTDGELTLVLSALETLREWRFEPAKLNGVPVPCFYTLTVRFSLR